jgi:hypothetical protein
MQKNMMVQLGQQVTLNAARNDNAGFGTQTAALWLEVDHRSIQQELNAETYNGTSWTSISDATLINCCIWYGQYRSFNCFIGVGAAGPSPIIVY